jgi:hypothetical protein
MFEESQCGISGTKCVRDCHSQVTWHSHSQTCSYSPELHHCLLKRTAANNIVSVSLLS